MFWLIPRSDSRKVSLPLLAHQFNSLFINSGSVAMHLRVHRSLYYHCTMPTWYTDTLLVRGPSEDVQRFRYDGRSWLASIHIVPSSRSCRRATLASVA